MALILICCHRVQRIETRLAVALAKTFVGWKVLLIEQVSNPLVLFKWRRVVR